MNLSLLFIFLFTAVGFLWFRLLKVNHDAEQKTKDFEILSQEYQSLLHKLDSRGQQLDVLFSTISEVVFRVDSQGRILGGNAKASKLFQFNSSLELPQDLLVFYRDVDWLDAYKDAVHSLPEEKKLPEMLVKGRVLLPKLASIDDKEALLVCLDVTAYTKLQQKQKALLENLMHDLKTPLTSLLGYAMSIGSFSDDKALTQEASDVIAKEANHINELLNQMLTLNRVEESKQDVLTAECDMSLVIGQVWKTLDYDLQKKQVKLDLSVSDTALLVQMADVDCHRILMNIASNAVKFTPQGSTIECLVEDSGDMLLICIQDQGGGVPEKYLQRITERFYRVDGVRGRNDQEGHGLGLSIVKEIIGRDGGTLSIHNREEGGLSVVLGLPKL
ncbi:MAG: ATP-binding protein [Ghiorsea sp.]